VELGGRRHAFFGQGELDELQFFCGKELSCSVPMILRDRVPKKSADVWTIGGIDHVVNYEMPLNAEVGTMLGSFIECKWGGLR